MKTEFYKVNINRSIKTVRITRDEQNFDSIDMNKFTSSWLWIEYIDKLIKDMFNTKKWEYLGDEEHYVPNKNELIIYVEYRNNENI